MAELGKCICHSDISHFVTEYGLTKEQLYAESQEEFELRVKDIKDLAEKEGDPHTKERLLDKMWSVKGHRDFTHIPGRNMNDGENSCLRGGFRFNLYDREFVKQKIIKDPKLFEQYWDALVYHGQAFVCEVLEGMTYLKFTDSRYFANIYSEKEFEMFMRALASNKTITDIEFCYMGVELPMVRSLCSALMVNTTVKHIRIDNTRAEEGCAVAKELARLLWYNTTIKRLTLNCGAIDSILSNPHGICDRGGFALAQALRHLKETTGFECLDLFGNRLSPKCCEMLENIDCGYKVCRQQGYNPFE